RFPNIIGERLLAINMLAVRQRQVSGKRVRVFRGGYDHGVEVIWPIKDAVKVGKFFGLWIALRSGVQRYIVDVTENGDVLIGMRPRVGSSSFLLPWSRLRPGM